MAFSVCSAGQVAVDYYYSRDTLFGRDVIAPTGWSYAFDLALIAQPASDWRIRLELQNLLGRVNWNNAPFTSAAINTDNKSYDENGYVKVRPLLNGQFGYRDFQQHLSLLGSLRLAIKRKNISNGLAKPTPRQREAFGATAGCAVLMFTGQDQNALYRGDLPDHIGC